MSYTLSDAIDNGDYEAHECALCDRVAAKTVTIENPRTGKIETADLCRICTKADLLEDLA